MLRVSRGKMTSIDGPRPPARETSRTFALVVVAVMALGAGASVLVGRALFAPPSAASKAPASTVPLAPSEPPRVAAAGASDAATMPPLDGPCDANALWFDRMSHEGEPEDNLARFTAWFAKRDASCRRTAMEGECTNGCGDLLSDRLIAAANDPGEAGALRRFRLDQNEPLLKTSRELDKLVRAITDRASRLRTQPRNMPKIDRGMSDDEIAEQISSLDSHPCIVRMRRDMKDIDDLLAKLKGRAPEMPAGLFLNYSAALGDARACLDCSDNRATCDDIAESLRNADEIIADLEKLVAADRKALGKAGPASTPRGASPPAAPRASAERPAPDCSPPTKFENGIRVIKPQCTR